MLNILVPGELVASATWTGKSVSINNRSIIGNKWIKKGKGIARKIPIIVKAPAYKDFCESIISMFFTYASGKPIEDPVFMLYFIGPHYWKKQRKDADAFHKPIQDGLQHAGIIKDDKQILSYAMIPMEPNESMDFVQVNLFHMKDLNDIKVTSAKERYDV